MPTNSEILNALGTGSNCLRTHKNLQPVKRPSGEYFFSTGNFSLVVKMQDPVAGKYYAVKCFTHIHPKLIESYSLIGKHLQMNQSPYLVHYEFCDNEIWVNSELDGKKGYPVIIMEWIEGKTLGSCLAELISFEDKDAIFQLACAFDALSLWLLDQPFAHGDLKPDNILVDSLGTLRLIDYDGVFTPEMLNQNARENGSPGFRHPKRLTNNFGLNIDDVSIIIISLSLHTLASKPALLGFENSFSDNIIFSEESLGNIEHPTWQLLGTLDDNYNISQRLLMLQITLNNSPIMPVIGIKTILQSTAYFRPRINNADEIPDEDIEIFNNIKKDAKGNIIRNYRFFGFKQKSTGLIICNTIYNSVTDFSEGMAIVGLEGKYKFVFKYGFINKTGNVIIPLIYDKVCNFSEGLASVRLKSESGYNIFKEGYIDKAGNIVIPLIYDYAGDFFEGLAIVYLNNKAGYIDKSGTVIIPLIYDSVLRFSEGLACVCLNGKWGFIDKNGNVIITLIYNNSSKFSKGIAIVKMYNKYGIIDKTGKVVIPIRYDLISDIWGGVISVMLNEKRGYIEKETMMVHFYEDDEFYV